MQQTHLPTTAGIPATTEGKHHYGPGMVGIGCLKKVYPTPPGDLGGHAKADALQAAS